MTLTEEEARSKWCPFVRAGNEAGCNRSDAASNGSLIHCIASACMAWRTSETPERKKLADVEFARSGRRFEPTGYCGLAGAP
jgi:hypothetical protein